jgi:hypothetical protein
MQSSGGRLALTILGTILFLQAAGETIEAPAPLCAEESAAPFVDLEPLEQTGQPCCQSLCEQTCGVGEACACKRCIVFGCGV